MPAKDCFRLVAELAAEGVWVRQACYALGVSPSGFHDWQARPPSSQSIRNAWVTDAIDAVQAETRGSNSGESVRTKLVHGHGLRIGQHTVGSLMRRVGLTCEVNTDRGVTVTDLVKRNSPRTEPS